MSYQSQDPLKRITIFYDEEDEEKILKLAHEAERKFASTDGGTRHTDSSSSDWYGSDGNSKGRHKSGGTPTYRRHSGDMRRTEREANLHEDVKGSRRNRMTKEKKDLDELRRNIESMEREVEMEEEGLWKMEKEEMSERERCYQEERGRERERRNGIDELRKEIRAQVAALEGESYRKINEKESGLRIKTDEFKRRRDQEEKAMKEETASMKYNKKRLTKEKEGEMRGEILKEKREGEDKRREIMDCMRAMERESTKKIMSIKDECSSMERTARMRMDEERRRQREELRKNEEEHRAKMNRTMDEWDKERKELENSFDCNREVVTQRIKGRFQEYIQSQDPETQSTILSVSKSILKGLLAATTGILDFLTEGKLAGTKPKTNHRNH